MKTDTKNALEYLGKVREYLTGADLNWVSSSLYEALCGFAASVGAKNSQILWPIRTALSGRDVSPGGATELAEILGEAETLRRIDIGISKLTASC